MLSDSQVKECDPVLRPAPVVSEDGSVIWNLYTRVSFVDHVAEPPAFVRTRPPE